MIAVRAPWALSLLMALLAAPAFSSGMGTCVASGVVTQAAGKKVIVLIRGKATHHGDTAGCRLKDGVSVEAEPDKSISKGDSVSVTGHCTNGMTPKGVMMNCNYSAQREVEKSP